MEYKIEVSMNPSQCNDYKDLYFWCIFGRNSDDIYWSNFRHGWAKTPEKAWEDAKEYYNKSLEPWVKELSKRNKEFVKDLDALLEGISHMMGGLENGYVNVITEKIDVIKQKWER